MVTELRTICCGHAMRALGKVDSLAPNVEKVERWLCPLCGRGLDLTEYFLEAEELQSELDLYLPGKAPEALLHIFAGGRETTRSELKRMLSLDFESGHRLPRKKELKGGDLNMAEENQSDEIATMCATKAGNGFKVVVNGVWYYTSKKNVMDLTQGRIKSCVFSTIKDEQ